MTVTGKPVFQKLGIKEQMKIAILNQPPSFQDTISGAPAWLAMDPKPGVGLDMLLVFCPDIEILQIHLDSWKKSIQPAGYIWVAWMKKTTNPLSRLSEQQIRDFALLSGLVDNKVCSIDHTWSALRLVNPLKSKAGLK